MKNKITNFFKEHYIYISLLVLVILGLKNLFTYLELNIIFNYYGLDTNLINNNFTIKDLLMGILLTFLFLGLTSLLNDFKKNKTCIFLLILNNCFILFLLISNLTILSFLINIICIILIEFLIIKFRIYEKLKDLFSDILLILTFLVITAFFNCFSNITTTEYRVIGLNKAVIYSTEEFYLTIDCAIEDSSLYMYKGTQQKLDTNDSYSILYKFDNINLD